MTGNIMSRFFSDSKAALHTHTQHCPACMLTFPTTSFLLLQTLPVNSNFCTTQVIADLAGASHVLNFLWNCLCTVTKLLLW